MSECASWSGKTVIVTGSTKGIGAATALLFGRCGAHVVVHGRDEHAADAVAGQIEAANGSASVAVADLAEPSAGARLAAHASAVTGHIDVLVNNAGANMFRGVLDCTLDDWNTCLDVDLRGAWMCARAAVPFMVGGSSIINVASNHAVATLAGAFPYNVAKAGMCALTQSLAIELAPRGIRANTVSPGYVDTPINDTYFATFADPAAARARAEQRHPLGRLGQAQEIASAIRFLASNTDSGFTTGTVMTIDGGRAALLEDPDPVVGPPTQAS